VSIDGMTPAELENALFNQYKIHTVGIVWENIGCVRGNAACVCDDSGFA
jgi:hypothetical protein